MSVKPTASQYTTFQQLCELIPKHLVPKLARKHGVQARSFSAWSHVVAMIFAQLTHAMGLNDVCDALRHYSGRLLPMRGATPPSRNGLSHANKTRSADMAEDLFWSVLAHLYSLTPKFGGRTYSGMPRRFKKTIHIVDSSTIALVANCMPWAKHRRRKAAAKLHLRLDLQCLLPSFVIIDSAKHNDNFRARELCAGLKAGEIVIGDKAYVDLDHLHDLDERDVFWVTREKDHMQTRCVKRRQRKRQGRIVRDDLVVFKNAGSREKYSKRFRRVQAIVEIDGKDVEMVFISNNLEWAATSICDLYKSRWSIESFFKQIKQVLKVCDFLGHSRNAIQWQLWTALLVYVLLRYLALQSGWNHSFTRIFTTVRSMLWAGVDLLDLLRSYGTAGGSFRTRSAPEQVYLPGFAPSVWDSRWRKTAAT